MHERRTCRSDDRLVALHYQLSATRAHKNLDALVIADADGLVVAGAGGWPLCEEVAAYAPIFTDGARGQEPQWAERTKMHRGDELWLCAVGQEESPELDWSSLEQAVTRILAA